MYSQFRAELHINWWFTTQHPIQGEFTQPRVNYHSSYPSPLGEEIKGCYVHINEGSMPSLSSHLGLVPILLLSVVRL